MPAENNSIWTITAIGKVHGQRIMTVLTYTPATIDLNPSDLTILDKLLLEVSPAGGGADKLESRYVEMVTAQFVLEQWWAQKIHPNRTAKRILTRNIAGTAPGVLASPNTAASFTKRTLLGGRKFVGRIQMVGPARESMTDGSINNTQNYITKAGPFGDAILTQLTGPGLSVFVPCLAHKPYSQNPPTALTTVSLQTTVRTMHRRTVGLGE